MHLLKTIHIQLLPFHNCERPPNTTPTHNPYKGKIKTSLPSIFKNFFRNNSFKNARGIDFCRSYSLDYGCSTCSCASFASYRRSISTSTLTSTLISTSTSTLNVAGENARAIGFDSWKIKAKISISS